MIRRLALAYALGLAPAFVMALGQPVWSRVDEAAHYDVIAQYAAGVYPRDSVTTIRPETLWIMEKTGVYGFVVDNSYAYPDPTSGFRPMPAGLSDAAHVLWIRRHGWQYSYEAFQPPLYYAVALPAWKLGDLIAGPMGALYAVRVLDALLAALLAPLSMLIALRVWPAKGVTLGWAAAVLTATLPGVALNLTSVTNDVLVSVLGAACVAVAITGRWTTARVLALGVLFGAALLTKTTAAGLVPALAIALLQRSRGGGLRPLAGVFATALAMVTPWVASNLVIYGEAFTTREQLAMAAFPARTAALDFWSVSTLHSFVTFWTGDPFLSIPLAVPLALLAAFVSALAIAGLRRAERTIALLVVAVAAAGMALVSVSSPVLAAFNAPGRLAYAGVAPAMALVAAGLWLELRSRRLRVAFVGGFAALALVGLVASAVPQPPPTSKLPVTPGGQVELATGTFRGLRINVLSCVVDPSGNLWLQIGLANMAGTPAEWSQTAEIRSGSETVATSDYRRSTHFPMEIPSDAVGEGWLFFGPSSRLSGLKSPSVVFRNIAAHDYQAIGDLSIPTALC